MGLLRVSQGVELVVAAVLLVGLLRKDRSVSFEAGRNMYYSEEIYMVEYAYHNVIFDSTAIRRVIVAVNNLFKDDDTTTSTALTSYSDASS